MMDRVEKAKRYSGPVIQRDLRWSIRGLPQVVDIPLSDPYPTMNAAELSQSGNIVVEKHHSG
jgi:hypothetical protein